MMVTFLENVGVFSRPIVDRAQPGDAEVLAAIHAEGFARGWDAAEIERMIRDPSVVASTVRRRANRPAVGFILSRIAADEAEVLTIAISRHQRGRRLSRPLMEAHMPCLIRRGVRSLFLEVAANNEPALALYDRLGFAEIGRRKGYYRVGNHTSDALTMRKDLPVM